MAYSDALRKEIARLLIDEAKTAKEILDRLGENPDFREEVPSERTVLRMMKAISDAYTADQQALDQPWQLRPEMEHGIALQDVPMLLNMLKWLSLWPSHFPNVLMGGASPHQALTIRRARWIATLRHTLEDEPLMEFWLAAAFYGNRERWAALENIPFETQDLDMWLAYAPWKSEENLLHYRLAVEQGIIPPRPIENLIRDLHPLDPLEAEKHVADFYAHQAELMEEAIDARNTEAAE